VRALSGCLGTLSDRQRRVLVLRAGAGPRHPLSRRAVARRLHIPLRRVVRIERRGLRHLKRLAGHGGCGGASGAGASASPGATAGTTAASPSSYTTAVGGTAGTASGGGTATDAKSGITGEGGGTAQSGVKDAFVASPPAIARVPGGGGGLELAAALLIALAFLVGAGITWKLSARSAGDRARA
jgi:hypothetical protein